MKIEFINIRHELYPAVKALGRKFASTLGFMPDGGFDDYATRRCIITASDGDKLMGYLMFRHPNRHNRVTIVHLAIDNPYQHKGIHIKLLDTLRDSFKNSGVQGIVLNCRKDYKKANAVWSNYGFVALGNKRSRSMEEHYLTTWWYTFQQRDLFSIGYEDNTKVRALLDLNVILKLRDAEKGEVTFHAKEDPRCLLADWLVGETEFCYAPEVFNEINRDNDLGRMRETLDYVAGAFTQALVDPEKMKQIATELNEILPGTSDNTKSDRKQVASCIAAEIPYFLTYDEGVIKKKKEIKTRYDLEIYTPQEFLLMIDQLLHSEDYTPVLLQGVAFHTIERLDARSIQKYVNGFLMVGKREKKADFENVVFGCVNDGGVLYSVITRDNILAFYGLSVTTEAATIHFLRMSDGLLKGSLLCQIVTNTLQECVAKGRRKVVVQEQYLDDDQKDVLLRYGFLSKSEVTFEKYIRDEVITQNEIGGILRGSGLKPKCETWSNEQMVRMELMFFPLKICDLEIPCYIIPIKQYWAGQLFDIAISRESLFGANPSKLWNFENVYYRHTRPITEKAPARILWYVSGGGRVFSHRMMIVGCSYLIEVHTGKGRDLYRRFKRYGIYEWKDIYELCDRDNDKDIRALKFSHTELFKQPLQYQDVQQVLAQYGFKTPNTFAGPLQVSNEVFFKMYRLGNNI